MTETVNADPAELAKFSDLAHRWWDPDSEFRPLHQINPLRLDWIDRLTCRWPASACSTSAAAAASSPRPWPRGVPTCWHRPVRQGAGGGAAACAGERARERGLPRDSAEALAAEQPGTSTSSPAWKCSSTCPIRRPSSAPAPALVKPGGSGVLLHHQPQSEGVPLRHGRRRIRAEPAAARHARVPEVHRPSELAGCCRGAGLDLRDTRGMKYNPLTRRYWLSADTSVNYLLASRKA